jgi:hypothetical protein
MHSVLLKLDIEMRALVLRLSVVRCRFMLQTETDPARQQQIRRLLHAAQNAEARLLAAESRICEHAASNERDPLARHLLALIAGHDARAEASKDHDSSNVVAFDAVAKSRARIPHRRSPNIPRG